MIRINQKKPNELIVNKNDFSKLLELESAFDNEEQKLLIQDTLNNIKRELSFDDIRIERDTLVGSLLFEQARKEIKNDPSEVYDSLLVMVLNNWDENTLDHFGEVLKQEEHNPSDFMVEHILMQRKGKYISSSFMTSHHQQENCMVRTGNFI